MPSNNSAVQSEVGGDVRPRSSSPTSLFKPKTSRVITAYLMLLPAMLILIVFSFYPIVWGIPLGFTDYSIIGKTHFVGFQNFVTAFQDPIFWISMRNSLLYVIVVPPLQLLSILLAVLINRKIKGITFFRTLYYIPVVTSMVAVAIAWNWMFNQQGVVNYILEQLHIISKGVDWMNIPSLSLYMVMFVTTWKGLGYYMLIYLAGLQSIPSELDEAARIDGANKWQITRHVTFPLLTPYILLCSVISVMGAIRVFDEVFVMTGGGPINATMVTSLYTYNKAFQDFQFGYASAVGLIVAVVVWLFTMLTFWINKKGGTRYYA